MRVPRRRLQAHGQPGAAGFHDNPLQLSVIIMNFGEDGSPGPFW